jgi:hypothetical protein
VLVPHLVLATVVACRPLPAASLDSAAWQLSLHALFHVLRSQGIKKRMAAWEAEQQTRAKRQADAEAVAKSAALIAFDRANHMGISEKTAEAIKVRH